MEIVSYRVGREAASRSCHCPFPDVPGGIWLACEHGVVLYDPFLCRQCNTLGAITMEVPPAPKGKLKFEVSFIVQADGTMKVTVSDIWRNRKETLDIVENQQILIWRGQSLGTKQL